MKNNQSIKAVSFDVWNTLIAPNPQFSARRKILLATELNRPVEQVSQMYTAVKRFVDTTAETTGTAFSTLNVYKMLLVALDVTSYVNLPHLINKVDELFLKYPPDVLTATRRTVQELSERSIPIGIASNSNFISGKTMHPFLEREFGVHFNFAVYSDLVGYAKPHREFFDAVADGAHLPTSNILHVGDNAICDGKASELGFKVEVIGHPRELSNVIKGIIQ